MHLNFGQFDSHQYLTLCLLGGYNVLLEVNLSLCTDGYRIIDLIRINRLTT